MITKRILSVAAKDKASDQVAKFRAHEELSQVYVALNKSLRNNLIDAKAFLETSPNQDEHVLGALQRIEAALAIVSKTAADLKQKL